MPGISLPPDRLGGVPSWPVLGVPPRGDNTEVSQIGQAVKYGRPVLLMHEAPRVLTQDDIMLLTRKL